MSEMTHYSLKHHQADWEQALQTVAHLLPSNIGLTHIEALRLLPLFAVVLVIDQSALTTDPAHYPDNLMHAWAEGQGDWLCVPVVATDKANDVPMMVSVAHEVGELAQVSVFRYILLPNKKSAITPQNREVVSYVIDEQLTAYLRKKLKPKANFNYQMNDVGEVLAYGFDNTKQHCVDCHILSIAQVLRPHKLACFDMDSTLIKQEVIVEIAKMAGIGEQVDKITERAMRGEIDFARSFVERVGLLKGVPATLIDEIKPLLIPQSGAFSIIALLKALGYHTVLISGGFVPFAKHIAELLGIDEYYANGLDIENDQLTGEVIFPILDGNQKAKIVTKITNRMAIDLSEVICIGDGANDLPMMNIADVGMAFHAKPIVQVKADVALNVTGLEGVLYALGYDKLQVLS